MFHIILLVLCLINITSSTLSSCHQVLVCDNSVVPKCNDAGSYTDKFIVKFPTTYTSCFIDTYTYVAGTHQTYTKVYTHTASTDGTPSTALITFLNDNSNLVLGTDGTTCTITGTIPSGCLTV